MAKAKAKVNTIPEEVTLVLSWDEFKAVATISGSLSAAALAVHSKDLLDDAERHGDLLRPRKDVEITKPVHTMLGLWRAVAPILLGGGYDG